MNAVLTEFKVTYYVGVMLAQGGSLIIKEDRILFSPRSIERAMGAVDVEIPFSLVKMVEVTGTITETLVVRTLEKPHRFVGSDLYKICDLINSSLQAYQSRTPQPSAPPEAKAAAAPAPNPAPATDKKPGNGSSPVPQTPQCHSCFKIIKADFNFCPHCQAAVKALCHACRKPVEDAWKFCAFCSTGLKP